ncbi:MAG: BamA/TamA family outer membrane protein, partial [Candidatus Krumholzibacteria bacterium]|nr:BamA/TamA family outer membrane protein [Candidatus Krumholzibacteria bacterium]
GAVWPELHYHEPGDGNLRGYYEGAFGANKMWAFNAEVGTRLYLVDRLLRPVLGKLGWYAFYDVGRVLDDTNPIGSSARVQGLVDAGILEATLQDAGIGLRSHRPLPFWDLRMRFDMPLWVSHPEVNGQSEQTRFRYLFSLTIAF